jgi:hypothetical protein
MSFDCSRRSDDHVPSGNERLWNARFTAFTNAAFECCAGMS